MSSGDPRGEVSGLILLGTITAFRRVKVISAQKSAHLSRNIAPDGWYPLAEFFSLRDQLMTGGADLSLILFQAGVEFIRQWYTEGPGHTIIDGGVDFLRYQAGSSGYSSVVRGRPADVGSVELAELDEAKGRARIVSINPFPRDFDRGAFYGGVTAPGDMDWVEVHSKETPHGELTRKDVTIRFRKRIREDWASRLERQLARGHADPGLPLSNGSATGLHWREQDPMNHPDSEGRPLDDISRILQTPPDETGSIASKDQLTRIRYRRDLLGIVSDRLSAHDRDESSAVSVAMLELDYFNELSDAWGHSAGDSVLEAVADAMEAWMGESDRAICLGADTLAVFLLDRNDALAATEGLRVNIAALSIKVRDVALTITASAGVATHNEGERLDRLLKRAQQALHEAKSGGRNRVVTAESG